MMDSNQTSIIAKYGLEIPKDYSEQMKQERDFMIWI